MVDAESTYYGAIRVDIDSGWGPTFTYPGNPIPPLGHPVTGVIERFRIIGGYFDPRMSLYILEPIGRAFHTNPTNFTSDPVTVQIPRSDFLFDDGLAPEGTVYSRTFRPRGPNTPAPMPGQNVGITSRIWMGGTLNQIL